MIFLIKNLKVIKDQKEINHLILKSWQIEKFLEFLREGDYSFSASPSFLGPGEL